LLHAGNLPAASGEQREKQSDDPASGHSRHIGIRPLDLSQSAARLCVRAPKSQPALVASNSAQRA
jgi:hypothetical protein